MLVNGEIFSIVVLKLFGHFDSIYIFIVEMYVNSRNFQYFKV